MDHDVLVEEQIEDGRRLLEAFEAASYRVAVAAWAKLRDSRLWELYIGLDIVDRAEKQEAFGQLVSSFRTLGVTTIHLALVRIGPIGSSPFSDLREIRDRYPSMVARKLKTRRQIGREETRGLYLYPPTFDLPKPDQVVHSVLQLLDRSGGAAPSVVTFRDGSQIHAVPVGIRLNTPDGARIDWHDVVTSQDRTVPAAEVVSIH